MTDSLDFPDSFDLLTPDVVASVLISLPYASGNSRDYEAPLEVTLEPGWYGLLFGGDGLFGAAADTSMPATNRQIGEPDYFSRLALVQDPECYHGPDPCTYEYSWYDGSTSNARMFLHPIPEPSSILLLALGLVGSRAFSSRLGG